MTSRSTSIKGLFQGLIPESAVIMQGKVISETPLKIQMVNNEKLIINERITIIPKHLTDYETDIYIEGQGRSKGVIYNSLKLYDIVHILSLNSGKLFYILDKAVT